MGYYVRYHGELSMVEDIDEAEVVAAIKNLNHGHDLKRGGRWPKEGEPYDDNWFSWLPARFHEDEDIKTVEDVIMMLGFDISEGSKMEGRRWFHIDFDNKIGQENLFLIELAKHGISIELECEGEDGDKWRYSTENNQLFIQEAIVEWGDKKLAEAEAHYQLNIVSVVANAFGN